MFAPIIHNLRPGDAGFAECQSYNKLIAHKPKVAGTLQDKIESERKWKLQCAAALVAARKAVSISDSTNNADKAVSDAEEYAAFSQLFRVAQYLGNRAMDCFRSHDDKGLVSYETACTLVLKIRQQWIESI